MEISDRAYRFFNLWYISCTPFSLSLFGWNEDEKDYLYDLNAKTDRGVITLLILEAFLEIGGGRGCAERVGRK